MPDCLEISIESELHCIEYQVAVDVILMKGRIRAQEAISALMFW